MDVRLIRAYLLAMPDSPHDAEVIYTQIFARLSEGESSLLSIVQGLGDSLTSDESSLRVKGISLLSRILSECPPEQLTSNAANVLVQFYCDRLHDQPSVDELIKGILGLLRFDMFSSTHAEITVQALFEHGHLQSHQQNTRFNFLKIIDVFLKRFLPNMTALGKIFLSGFIQSMDGEKDPRNLLIGFRLVKTIIEQFDIDEMVEDLFDVVFCYFPITFRPPPDDPYGITPEDLKLSLRACLSSTAKFSRLATPLLLEKLSASSGAARRDAIETITACAPVFGAEAFANCVESCWESLKEEVIASTDPQFEEAALRAMYVLTQTLSESSMSGSNSNEVDLALQQFITLATKESFKIMKDPESQLLDPLGNLLHSIASASQRACHALTQSVLPCIYEHLSDLEGSAPRRKSLLHIVVRLLEASSERHKAALAVAEDGRVAGVVASMLSPLETWKERLIETFSTALRNDQDYGGLRICGIRGLFVMSSYPGFLTTDDHLILIQHLVETVLRDDEADVRENATTALKNLYPLHSSAVKELAINALMHQLPTSVGSVAITKENDPKLKRALDALVRLSELRNAFSDVTHGLLFRLEHSASMDHVHQWYPEALLETLTTVVQAMSKIQCEVVAQCAETLVPRVVQLSIRAATIESSESPHALNKPVNIIRAAGILSLIMQSLDATRQREHTKNFLDLYLRSDTRWLKGDVKEDFHPFKVELQSLQIPLFVEAVGSVRSEVLASVVELPLFISDIISVGINAHSSIVRSSVAVLVAACFNKWNEDEALSLFLHHQVDPLWNSIQDDNSPVEHRTSTLLIVVAIIRGLALKTHPLALGYTSALVDLLQIKCEEVALCAATAFGEILKEAETGPLCKKAFVHIKLLYRQRVSNQCIPRIVSGFHKARPELKHRYLTALSYLLRFVPRPVLIQELPPLFPLLLQSMSTPDIELRLATLALVDVGLLDAPKTMSEHIGSVITRLLILTRATSENPARIRSSALKCLDRMAGSFRYDKLHPYKADVVSQLLSCLDDRKRDVRKDAVTCRNRWLMLSGS